MACSDKFESVKRQQFRRWFQPSRIILCGMPGPAESGLNVIKLCFTMYCSYKPPMLAMAVHNINASYELIQRTTEYVLTVPGVDMVTETLTCGLRSARDCDKMSLTGLETVQSEKIDVPGRSKALANVEMVKHVSVITGDHILVVGRVVNFRVKLKNKKCPTALIDWPQHQWLPTPRPTGNSSPCLRKALTAHYQSPKPLAPRRLFPRVPRRANLNPEEARAAFNHARREALPHGAKIRANPNIRRVLQEIGFVR